MNERILLAVFVALGSALGGVARFFVAGSIQLRAGAGFPWGTLVVNVTGSLLFGALLHLAMTPPSMSPQARVFLTAGFCGGYTTFSTFSYETVALIEEGHVGRATAYVAGSVIVSIISVALGIALARAVLEARGRA